MPAWPTLYPGLAEGKTNEILDTRVIFAFFSLLMLMFVYRQKI